MPINSTDTGVYTENTHRKLLMIIWAIVRKQGGEVRLSDANFSVINESWELRDTVDPVTDELVIKARLVPVPIETASARARKPASPRPKSP